ncbi:MHYT domain-containing protein [Kiloniella sp. EL199]|uniref:MHYT domain-containing protein n=1 Tax=Kiloniella sp. EL199 TaxID=2107581 RepID=UPI000EA31997|nr:MHYT domain-containing protein [Kiloniella sp. EL199]
MPLEVAYSPLLIISSLAVAIMGAFTALRLTSNLRNLDAGKRKARVTQGALALGTGIWSMHFTGMLAVELPITISYDPLRTLASALIAVLVVGIALLSLHFGIRTKTRIAIAGTITGLGIVGMHYLGMSAISANCIVTYSPTGIILAIGIGIASSIAAIELAYGNRSLLSISAGSVVLGLAISAMHYSAMYFTVFSLSTDLTPISPNLLDNDRLALVIVLSSFVISGLFLLLAIPGGKTVNQTNNIPEKVIKSLTTENTITAELNNSVIQQDEIKIPYEQNKIQRLLSAKDIHVVKADGHYTLINDGSEDLFCPWSISRLEKHLNPENFIRTHRSFIVNRKQIIGFRRDGDKAYCIIGNQLALEIPVSRTKITELRKIIEEA